MGLLGYIAGGALQGLGTGITNDAIQKREAALAAARQQAQAQHDDAVYQRTRSDQLADHARDRGEKVDDQNTAYTQKQGLLALGAQVDASRDATQHGYKMAEIKQTQVGQQELATLQSNLQSANTQAEIRLRDQLTSGDITNVTRGADGQYYGVTKNGLVATGVQAPPTDASEVGGGRLTESEQNAAYDDDRKAWREGGSQGPEPKKSDYIGMTRATFNSKHGKGAASPASPGASTTPITTKPNGQMSDRDLALSQLATSYANATPDKYPLLFQNGQKIPFDQARVLVEQRYGK